MGRLPGVLTFAKLILLTIIFQVGSDGICVQSFRYTAYKSCNHVNSLASLQMTTEKSFEGTIKVVEECRGIWRKFCGSATIVAGLLCCSHAAIADTSTISSVSTQVATPTTNENSGAISTSKVSSSRPKSLLETSMMTYSKQIAPVNIPSDDFWYPPFLLGRWDTVAKFRQAEFAPGLPVQQLIDKHLLPGLSPYSIFPFPGIGKDVQHPIIRFVSLDGHPRQDYPFNLRQWYQKQSPETVIDDAKYSFQKAPTWFSAPANHWNIKYHDEKERGSVEIVTKKREIQVYAGVAETTQYISQNRKFQVINLPDKASNNEGVVKQQQQEEETNYAIHWKFAVPQSSRDEFVKEEDISESDELVGQLDLYVYFKPGSDWYLQYPGRPVGVYSYDLSMHRLVEESVSPDKNGINGEEEYAAQSELSDSKKNTKLRREEMKKVTYPFVWRSDGPVELDQYFGY